MYYTFHYEHIYLPFFSVLQTKKSPTLPRRRRRRRLRKSVEVVLLQLIEEMDSWEVQILIALDLEMRF